MPELFDPRQVRDYYNSWEKYEKPMYRGDEYVGPEPTEFAVNIPTSADEFYYVETPEQFRAWVQGKPMQRLPSLQPPAAQSGPAPAPRGAPPQPAYNPLTSADYLRQESGGIPYDPLSTAGMSAPAPGRPVYGPTSNAMPQDLEPTRTGRPYTMPMEVPNRWEGGWGVPAQYQGGMEQPRSGGVPSFEVNVPDYRPYNLPTSNAMPADMMPTVGAPYRPPAEMLGPGTDTMQNVPFGERLGSGARNMLDADPLGRGLEGVGNLTLQAGQYDPIGAFGPLETIGQGGVDAASWVGRNALRGANRLGQIGYDFYRGFTR